MFMLVDSDYGLAFYTAVYAMFWGSHILEWEKIVPVVISILVIIFVAIISESSKTVAAITATMPLTAPLSLWVVYAAEKGDKLATSEYALGMFVGIIPTMIFVLVAWWMARAGYKLVPIIGAGYAAWGVALGAILIARRMLG